VWVDVTEVVDFRHEVGQVVLSGIQAGSDASPRGVIVALHGSGYTSRYWDGPHDPESSLLRLGAGLGFRVLAVDRPGYGASTSIPTEQKSIEAQAGVLGQFIREVNSRWAPVPVFLIGHSLGSLLAVRIAAREAAGHVSAIDVAGLPYEWRPDIRDAVQAHLEAGRSMLGSAKSRAQIYFGPPSTYDLHGLAAVERSFASRIPGIEMRDSLDSPAMLSRLGPMIKVPVQCTVAEHEQCVVGGDAAVDGNRRLFTASPLVVAHRQVRAGHNVSLHRIGRAYHLRALAFFEEVIASEIPFTLAVDALGSVAMDADEIPH
jgi:pimeloyl-ACP methyl ester carboxylesterase